MTSQFPIHTISPVILPLLIEAHIRLRDLAAPQASRIADQIGACLETLIDIAGDVEAYGSKWTGGRMEELATQIREATKVWHAA